VVSAVGSSPERQRRAEYIARKGCRQSAWLALTSVGLLGFAAVSLAHWAPVSLEPLFGIAAFFGFLVGFAASILGCINACRLLLGTRSFRLEKSMGCAAALLGPILLVAILLSLFQLQRSYFEGKAEREADSISMAVRSYHADTGRMPIAGPGGDGPVSMEIVNVLTANDPVRNPKGIVYVETEESGTDGAFRDPWDIQYRILLDHDLDGHIHYSGTPYRTACIVVSAGRDKIFATKDDVIHSD